MIGAARRQFWRTTYDLLGRLFRDDFAFMNYGYAPLPGERLALDVDEDLGDERYAAQLYLCAGAVDMAGKRVLEVGSGRGGGAALLARTQRPAKLMGVDFSSGAVSLAVGRFGDVPNLEFRVGDAESLDLADASFDVLLNVESSHCYGSFSKFAREASRVLVKDGVMSWVDFRPARSLPDVRIELERAGFAVEAERDIRANVVSALRLDNARRAEMAARVSARVLRAPASIFCAVEGSSTRRKLVRGDHSYYHYVLRRR